MPEVQNVQTIDEILTASAATDGFKDAVRALADERPQQAIACNAGLPPVKALRFVLKMLEECPGVAFESVAIEAASGCSDFGGRATAQPGEIAFEFKWCCAWRAREQGWKDFFGDPDQIRAAREFGYQCFELFERK